MHDSIFEWQTVGNQRDWDEALSELFEAMSTGLSHVVRFDKVAMAEEDKAVILKVAKKTQECALFISEYTNTPGFGTLSLCRIQIRIF